MAPSIAKTTLIREPNADAPFKPQETGFDFAFGLAKPIDASYGFMTAKYIR